MTNIESGRTAGAPQSLTAIREALETAGVELSNSGMACGVSQENAGPRTKLRLRYRPEKRIRRLNSIAVAHHQRQIDSPDLRKLLSPTASCFSHEKLIHSGANNQAGSSMTPGQCRAARAFIGMSQKELAKRAKVGLVTIIKFETGTRVPYPQTIDAIVRALDRAGVELTNEDGPGVRLRWGTSRTKVR